ncbi:MAG: radical SAM protein [Prevotella sp.]|nr:radical SAM protein [Prevotella sp.]MBQ8153794.1 radical SAM protein [Prevotella sp.]MBQ8713701.1 radical SAM protein [Prevotella sp.]
MKHPLIGICRHRLATDGQGVTTLVAFHGCPLRCKYCLNSQCLQAEGVWQWMDVEEILDEVMVDDLYFKATGGGVSFGGGEPLLRSDGIVDFCKLCPKEWHICVETSLNVERCHLEAVAPYIYHYYIDVKDMNHDIYRPYTKRSNRRVINNLRWLASHVDPDKVTIRLPHIPDYNTLQDIERSQQQLEEMGFKDFDRFEYITPNAG